MMQIYIYIYIYIYIEKLHNIFRRSSKGSTNTSRYFEFLLLILFNISSCACVISSALLIQRIAVVNFDIILCLGNIMKSTIGVSHLNKVILSRKAYWSVYDEISLQRTCFIKKTLCSRHNFDEQIGSIHHKQVALLRCPCCNGKYMVIPMVLVPLKWCFNPFNLFMSIEILSICIIQSFRLTRLTFVSLQPKGLNLEGFVDRLLGKFLSVCCIFIVEIYILFKD